ncbi:heme ABC transporter ATP-binding protein [Comamonas sp. GB3 AK4-5]|uniref:heme ABC transporter ATP-binding protein n=1 Tax=Comamonas sp. GB3 AK4-5 TaxID=3231487 RepID=UPI00351F77C4
MNALTEEEAAMLQGLEPARGAHGGLHCQGLQIAAQRRGPLLAQVDARLRPGRVTAILGPNGAGKSTLLAALCGQQPARQGLLLWDGQPLARQPSTQRARRMAVMHQDTQLAFAFTVQDVVDMGRYPHRQAPAPDEAAIVQHCLQATGVAALAQREMASLSGGERARVQLARALAQIHGVAGPEGDVGGSRWLLLDEPTAALDLQHQHQAMALVRARSRQDGLGVVVVLHDLNLALRYADDVLLLPGQGAAAQWGAVQQVLTLATIARVWRMQGEFSAASDGTPQFIAGACCSPQRQSDGTV